MNTKLNKAPVLARAPLGPQVIRRRSVQDRKPVQLMDTSWQEKGTCRTVDPEWFYPGKGRNDLVLAAKNACSGCPVKDHCLLFALETDPINDWGIWGGTTKDERISMRRNLRAVKNKAA